MKQKDTERICYKHESAAILRNLPCKIFFVQAMSWQEGIPSALRARLQEAGQNYSIHHTPLIAILFSFPNSSLHIALATHCSRLMEQTLKLLDGFNATPVSGTGCGNMYCLYCVVPHVFANIELRNILCKIV